jgi:hypothetical protein
MSQWGCISTFNPSVMVTVGRRFLQTLSSHYNRTGLGRYTDELAIECRSSLLITRKYSQVTSHLASVLSGINSAASMGKDESGVGV